MRFFTEHFFTEEQKAELLGDKYAPMRRRIRRAEEEACLRAIEAEQTRAHVQLRQHEFDRESKLVERITLPLVLFITLAAGLLSSFLMDGKI